jgi:hypothetical protein
MEAVRSSCGADGKATRGPDHGTLVADHCMNECDYSNQSLRALYPLMIDASLKGGMKRVKVETYSQA